ncbi:MAG TPA: hypothetical protein VNJ02_11710 [Vicinamibacterales bacterium]|nr:hypothetical protein [Vicinamibacterales bacterium]
MPVIRLLIVLFAIGVAAPMVVNAQPPQPAQEEFVPVDQLPPEAELPAARMVIGAYVFVWVAFVAYIFTLVKRVKKVEGDLAMLERDRR